MALANQEGITSHFIVSEQFAYGDSTKAVIDIPANTLVRGVQLVITEGFDGTASIDVGDSADSDIWIDTSDVTETTAGVYVGDGGDATYYTGHWYSSATDLKITYSATTPSQGACHVVAEVLPMDDLV